MPTSACDWDAEEADRRWIHSCASTPRVTGNQMARRPRDSTLFEAIDIPGLAQQLKDDDVNSSSFRRDLKGAEEMYESHRTGFKQIAEASKKFGKGFQGYDTGVLQFSECLKAIADFELSRDQTNALGLAMLKFGLVNAEINTLQREMIRALNNCLTYPCETAIKDDSLSHTKRTYERTRSTYESLKNRANKATDEDEKRSLMRELDRLHHKLQLETCDFLLKLAETESKRDVDFMNNFHEFYTAQVHFHQESLSVLQGLQSYMNRVDSETVELKNRFQSEKKFVEDIRAEIAGITEVDDGVTRAKILTSYTAERPSELSLVKGNVIVVLEKPQADWWKGEYKGVVGYFPSDHVLELVKTASTAAASNSTKEVIREGYLLKKPEKMKVLQAWQKRFCSISDGKFHISHNRDVPANHSLDLTEYSASKADDDESERKKFCFKLISRTPGERTYIMQATSEEDVNAWVQIVRNHAAITIATSVGNDGATASKQPQYSSAASSPALTSTSATIKRTPSIDGLYDLVGRLFDFKGNAICADCLGTIAKTPEQRFYSRTFGVILCSTCASVHRGLPQQTSQIKSFSEKASVADLLLLKALGNTAANNVLEGTIITSVERLRGSKIRDNYDLQAKSQFIEAKYVKKQFAEDFDTSSGTTVDAALMTAIANSDISSVLSLLANGADVNAHCPGVVEEDTPLHQAIVSNFIIGAHFLIINGANVNANNDKGESPLHVAVARNLVEGSILLLKAGADMFARSGDRDLTVMQVANLSEQPDPTLISILERWEDEGDYGQDWERAFVQQQWEAIPAPADIPQTVVSFMTQVKAAPAAPKRVSSFVKPPAPPVPAQSPAAAALLAGGSSGSLKREPPPIPMSSPALLQKQMSEQQLEASSSPALPSAPPKARLSSQASATLLMSPASVAASPAPGTPQGTQLKKSTPLPATPQRSIPPVPTSRPAPPVPTSSPAAAAAAAAAATAAATAVATPETSEEPLAVEESVMGAATEEPPTDERQARMQKMMSIAGRPGLPMVAGNELSARLAKRAEAEGIDASAAAGPAAATPIVPPRKSSAVVPAAAAVAPAPTATVQPTAQPATPSPAPKPKAKPSVPTPGTESPAPKPKSAPPPAETQVLPAEMEFVKALFDCSSDVEGDLSFKKGDFIVVLNKRPDGWWNGKLFSMEANGPVGDEGVFPSNFVESVQ